MTRPVSRRASRVLITRPEPNDGPLGSAFVDLGFDVVWAPTIQVERVSSRPNAERLDQYDWALWTSAAAVDAVKPNSTLRVKHAAVGPSTAQALNERGIEAEIVGDSTSAELATMITKLDPKPHRVIYPRSALAKQVVVETLESADIAVDAPVAYTIEDGPAAAVLAAIELHVDVVTFASPSAVAGFVRAGAAGRLTNELFASLGPTTTAALRDMLRSPDIEGDTPTFASLALTTRAYVDRTRS